MIFIKYCIYYLIIIISLFVSKDQLDPANQLWVMLFNHYNYTNKIIFVLINFLYLSIIYLYCPSRRILFRILHVILNKFQYFNFILFTLKFYYLIYLKYFQLKQVFLIKFHLYIISNSKFYNNVWIKSLLYLNIFEPSIFLPVRFSNKKEMNFYMNLYKKFYLFPIELKIDHKNYQLTIIELLSLVNRYIPPFLEINYKKEAFSKFKFKSKLINKFMKIFFFWNQLKNLYHDLQCFDWRYSLNGISKYKNKDIKYFLKYFTNPLSNYNIKTTTYLLKTFNRNINLIIQFIIIILNKNLNQFKKRLKRKKILLSVNSNSFYVPIYKMKSNMSFFNSIEFNSFYVYFNCNNFKTIHKLIVVSNFLKEFKIMYQLIKWFFIYHILSNFIVPDVLVVILPVYIFSKFVYKFIYIHFIIQNLNYWFCKRLILHTFFRIIYYSSLYQFNLFFFDINFIYFLFLNYIFFTFIFILIISLYDINYNFFYSDKYSKKSLFNCFKHLILSRIKNFVLNTRVPFILTVFNKIKQIILKERTKYLNKFKNTSK